MVAVENGVEKLPPIIHTLQEKTDPVDDDVFFIEDSEDGFSQKKVKRSSVGGGGIGDDIDAVIRAKMLLPYTNYHTDTDPASLNTLIQSLPDKSVVEVNSVAIYDPISIPADREMIIRATPGKYIHLTGTGCIKLMNGARNVLVAGVNISNCSSASVNDQGAGVTFGEIHAIVTDITFYDMTIDAVTLGSGVMLSYHWSVGADYYYTPNTIPECSNQVNFVDCSFFGANTSNTEGAAIALRGIIDPSVMRCHFKDDAQSMRQLQFQNCIRCYIQGNQIRNTAVAGTNSEGIKLDDLGGCTYRTTGWVIDNVIKNAVEGIDIDDNVDAVVWGNVCYNCTEEGISVDDSATAVIRSNLCYNCRYDSGSSGIRVEAGAVVSMFGNNCFNNITNYRIENGYSLPASNSETLINVILKDSAENVPYSGSIAGVFQVKEALEAVNDRPYTDVTGTSGTLAVSKMHGANNSGLVTLTLPTTAKVGQRIAVIGVGAGGWTIAQNASQSIRMGATVSTIGATGTVSGDQGEAVEIVCVVENTTWVVSYSSGTLTFV